MWDLYSFVYTSGHSIFCTKALVIIYNLAYSCFMTLSCSLHDSHSTVWIHAADIFKHLADYTLSRVLKTKAAGSSKSLVIMPRYTRHNLDNDISSFDYVGRTDFCGGN
jgi:hypothetical protein